MSCRHLNISFKENGDVEYHYFRHHSEYKLSKYIIEYPIEKIQIIGGQEYDEDNFTISRMSNGHALLEWDKVKKDNGARGINYIKKDYMKKLKLPDGSFTFRYFEEIKIKASKPNDTFSLWLHTPFSKMSAIKNKSTAVFNGLKYKPGELSEIVFRQSGILIVDWELEILRD
jgi:hypothetical protein